MLNRKYRLVIPLYLIITISDAYSEDRFQRKVSGFYDQRYKGWLWYENKDKEKLKIKKPADNEITPEQAQKEIEDLKAKLDSKRSIMIARPSPEAVRDYMQYEQIMWKKALALDAAYRQAKFLYPNYYDKLKDPQNVHAVKFKRKLEQQALEAKITDFASKFDLVFFSRGNCNYCHEFAPILKRFSESYGFKVEEASIDGEMTGIFSGRQMKNLATKLGIEATPTVVVVSRDGKTAFELIRGYVTKAELEEYIGLAIDYVKDLEGKYNKTTGEAYGSK